MKITKAVFFASAIFYFFATNAVAGEYSVGGAIEVSSGIVARDFTELYGGAVSEVAMKDIGNMKLLTYFYKDVKTGAEFDMESQDFGKYLSLLPAPVTSYPWLAPLEKEMVAAKMGNRAAQHSFAVHLAALASLAAGYAPDMGDSWKSDEDIPSAQNTHYMSVTKDMHFANILSAEIASKLHKTYASTDDVLKDFLTALVSISGNRLYQLKEQSLKTTNGLFGKEVLVNVANAKSQSWSAGPYTYDLSQNGVKVEKDGKPFFGQGYINGAKEKITVTEGSAKWNGL